MLLSTEKRRKLMCRNRRLDWDASDDIEDGHLDDESSSSDDLPNATRYVPTSSGSPVKIFFRSEKQKALGMANPVHVNPSGKTLT